MCFSYRSKGWNDLALIHLDQSVDVEPIPLCGNKPAGVLATCGMGRVEKGAKLSAALREILIFEVKNDEASCTGSHDREHTICSFGLSGATCGEDAGGPLYSVENHSLPCLYGVMLEGACNGFDVATSLLSYQDWINYIIGLAQTLPHN